MATQLSEQLDVEARSRQLADIAKREREEKTRAAAAAVAKQEMDERAKAPEEVTPNAQPVQSQEGIADLSSEETAATAATAQVDDGEVAPAPMNGSSPPHLPASKPIKSPSALSPPSLNPAAPAFQPRFAPATPPTPPSPVEAAPAAAPSVPAPEDFPSLPNGHNVAEKPDEAGSPTTSNGPAAHESVHDAESLANVGKSWAEIVKENAPSAENGADDLAAEGEKSDVEQVEDDSEPRMASQELNGNAGTESDELAQSPQVEETLPKKTKAELWHEIKTLCTSLLGVFIRSNTAFTDFARCALRLLDEQRSPASSLRSTFSSS